MPLWQWKSPKIAALISDLAKATRALRKAEMGANAGDPLDRMINLLDQVPLDQGLVLRIVFASHRVCVACHAPVPVSGYRPVGR